MSNFYFYFMGLPQTHDLQDKASHFIQPQLPHLAKNTPKKKVQICY